MDTPAGRPRMRRAPERAGAPCILERQRARNIPATRVAVLHTASRICEPHGRRDRRPEAIAQLSQSCMREILEIAAARDGDLIAAVSLRELGAGSHAAETLVAQGTLVRIRYGVYVDAALWRDLDRAGRYRLLVRATGLSSRRAAVISHMSAAAMHGLPTIGAWPKTVHVTVPDATGGSHGQATTRHRHVLPPEVVVIDGLAVTSLRRTLVDVAASTSFLVGVTMIDDALRTEMQRVEEEERRGLAVVPPLTKEDLHAELALVSPRRGGKHAERAIDFANGLAANPGETLSRVRMFELGFEVPELQVHFFVEGREYWVDYFWRGVRKIGEFDGRHKYTRGVVLGDRDPGDVVWEEKRREDALRRHVNSFSRWDWETAISPRRFYDFLMEQGVPRA
jgi:predicted transcriptional regulator of viral defense system